MKQILPALLFLGFISSLHAQSVAPVIVEYNGNAEGKVALTNDSLSQMVVVVEPRSFDINADGRGIFRPLDDSIHLQLSSRSKVLQPKETFYIFYKVKVERLPAWFTLYASFSKVQHSNGLDMRIMLPHTVYLYQKVPLSRSDILVRDLTYNASTKKLTANVTNNSFGLGRVQMVHATGGRSSLDSAGFPLLPGASRQIELDWKEPSPPTNMELRFAHFNLNQPVVTLTSMK
jgi:hypothetical protein